MTDEDRDHPGAASTSSVTVRPWGHDEDPASLSDLFELVTAADGHPPIGAGKWQDVIFPHRRPGFTFVAVFDAEPVPSGLARLSRNPGAWGLELMVRPDLRRPDRGVGRALIGAAVSQVHESGGGRLDYWVLGWAPGESPDGVDAGAEEERRHREAEGAGFTLGRRLRQLRCPLPVPPQRRAAVVSADVRPFRPGIDDDAWLEVNNRAFADHPEQGHWDRATFASRQQERWFDAAGFLLQWEAGRLVGSCWTKIHRDTDPPMGEIYVISVDPRFHGGGRGTALTLAGLDWLAGQGLHVGMLYVDAANRPANRLYAALGFTEHHVDLAYVMDVPGPG